MKRHYTGSSSVNVEYGGKILRILVKEKLQSFTRNKLIAEFQYFAEIQVLKVNTYQDWHHQLTPDSLRPDQFSEPGCGKSCKSSLESNEFLSANIKDHNWFAPYVVTMLIRVSICLHIGGLNSYSRKSFSDVGV